MANHLAPIRFASPRFAFFPALLVSAFALGSVAACGGTPPTQTTPTATAAASDSTTSADDVAPDMSPVTKPSNVVFTLRFSSLGKTVEAVDKLVKLPKSLRSMLDTNLQKRSLDFIDVNGGVDIAVALDGDGKKSEPDAIFAVSIPVKSLDDAVAAAKKLDVELKPTGKGAYHARGHEAVCTLGPSLGESQTRLVCSERESGLETLSAWMVRGLAAEPKPAADGWVHVDVGPIREKFFLTQGKPIIDDWAAHTQKDMSRDLPKLDADVMNVPTVLVNEASAIVDDADSLEGSFKIDPDKSTIDLSLNANFRSKTSWVVSLIDEAGANATTPPDLFLRLPKDASGAFFMHSADPAKFTGIRNVVHKALTSMLDLVGAKAKMSDADKKSLVAWVDGFPSVSGNWVSATGHAPQKATPAKDLTAQQAVDAFKAEVQGIVPWSISGGDGDPANSIAWLKLTQDAITKGVADIKAVAGKKAAELTFLPTAKVTTDPAGYPKGSADLAITFSVTSKEIWKLVPQNKGTSPPKTDAKGDVTLHIVVVPEDAGHFWWGYAFDGDALKTHLNAVLKTAPATGQLGARTDLDSLKSHKGFGGFINIGESIANLDNLMPNRDKEKFDAILGAAPHKLGGDLFILGEATSGKSPSVALHLLLGKEWVEDLTALFQAGAKFRGGAAP